MLLTLSRRFVLTVCFVINVGAITLKYAGHNAIEDHTESTDSSSGMLRQLAKEKKQSFTVSNLAGYEFYLSPQEPCRCSADDLKKTLAPFNGSDYPFLHFNFGSKAQTISLSDQIISTVACKLTDGTSSCGRLIFKLIDSKTRLEISTFPHKGITLYTSTNQLTLHPQSDEPARLHKGLLINYLPKLKDVFYTLDILYLVDSPPLNNQRKLSKQNYQDLTETKKGLSRQLQAGQGYCQNQASLLNLFNTQALAEQSLIDVTQRQKAATGCDGDVVQINTDTSINPNKLTAPDDISFPSFWKVTFQKATPIKTTLFIDIDYSPPSTSNFNLFAASVGNNTDVTTNPTCVSKGTMTDGGWYICPTSLIGTTFGLYSLEAAGPKFIEAMAYSQEAIQMNALSVSIIGTYAPDNPVSNSLQNIVILNIKEKTICTGVKVNSVMGRKATFIIKFKAQTLISGVVLIPCYKASLTSDWPAYQTNVKIYVNTVGGPQKLCGVLDNYYSKYGEIMCNLQADEIIIEQQTDGYFMGFCGIGALADCNCSQSLFDPLLFLNPSTPFASATSITVTRQDKAQAISFNTQIPDTISSNCGLADGISKCGPRVISFRDKFTGLPIFKWPYLGFDWNSLTSVLTLDPEQVAATSVLTATLSLIDYPVVFLSQDITVTVMKTLNIPNQTINVFINKQAFLQLPIIIGVQYIVTSTQSFKALVNGQLLIIISTSKEDIGTKIVQMRAFTASQTQEFTLSVMFKDKTAKKEIANTSTKETSKSLSKTSKSLNVASPANGTALTVNETDSLLDSVQCSKDNLGDISCQTSDDVSYTLSQATGTFIIGKSTTQTASVKPPTLQITKVNTKGLFSLKFSEPVGLEPLILPATLSRRLKADKAFKVRRLQAKAGNQLYLLSDKHLNISIQSENTTTPVFSWHAKHITSKEIMIQLIFQDPLYISNQAGILDKLVVTILPPSIQFMRSLASGALTENLLRTVSLGLPPQVILGTAIDSVEAASESLKDTGLTSTFGNVFIQILLSQSMAQMWSMVNAQQIIMTYQVFSMQMPGNVILVITNLANISSFTIFPTADFFAWLFNFTPTDAPGAGFLTMGVDNVSVALQLGMAFLIMILIGLQYLLYSLAFTCKRYDKLFSRIEQKLKPGLIFKTFYLFLVETYLDWAISSALRLEQPKFVTPSDYFDFGLACVGVVITLVLPCYCFFFLKRNVNLLDNEDFKSKHGALYEGFITDNALKRQASMQMPAWFLLRRFFTAVNLVYLRNNTIWIQLTLNMWLCLIDVSVKLHLSPYESKVGGFVEKFNDMFVLSCAYFTYLFTDLIPSQEDKYYIGWFYQGIIGMLLVSNLFVMVISAFQDLKEQIRGMIKKCRLQKETEAQNARRELQKTAMKQVKLNTVDGVIVTVVKPRTNELYNELYQDQKVRLEQFKAFKQFQRQKAFEKAKAKAAKAEAERLTDIRINTMMQLLNISEVIEEEESLSSERRNQEASQALQVARMNKMLDETLTRINLEKHEALTKEIEMEDKKVMFHLSPSTNRNSQFNSPTAVQDRTIEEKAIREKHFVQQQQVIDQQLLEIEERKMTDQELFNKKYGMNLDDPVLFPQHHSKHNKKGPFLIDPYIR